jgi:uncharacterized protein YdaU (DUF1376 family)
MGKDPAFLFYPGDWLGGTMTMTRAHKGAYMDVLMAQFNSGHLSIDEIKIILGTDFEIMWEAVLRKKFSKDSNGLFYNDKLEREIIKRQNYSNSRKANLVGKTEPHMDTHMDCHMENGNEIKDEIVNNPEIELLVNEYYKYQESINPKLIKVNDNLIKNSIDTVDKLIRIDGFSLDEIKTVLSFVIKDDFWSKQILSLVSLRNKSKNGNTKFVNAKLSIKKSLSEKNKEVLERWAKDYGNK